VGYVRPTIDEEVLSCQSEYINYKGLILDGQLMPYKFESNIKYKRKVINET